MGHCQKSLDTNPLCHLDCSPLTQLVATAFTPHTSRVRITLFQVNAFNTGLSVLVLQKTTWTNTQKQTDKVSVFYFSFNFFCSLESCPKETYKPPQLGQARNGTTWPQVVLICCNPFGCSGEEDIAIKDRISFLASGKIISEGAGYSYRETQILVTYQPRTVSGAQEDSCQGVWNLLIKNDIL